MRNKIVILLLLIFGLICFSCVSVYALNPEAELDFLNAASYITYHRKADGTLHPTNTDRDITHARYQGELLEWVREGNFAGVLQNNEVTILSSHSVGDNNAVIIPTHLGGYLVTGIGSLGYTRELILPATITSFSPLSVKWMNQLRRIIVDPNNPVYADIDGVLFEKATKTLVCFPVKYEENVYSIPEGILTIGPYSFLPNLSLKEIILPQSLKTISDFAFISCERLSSINLPSKLETIGSFAFAGSFYSSLIMNNAGVPIVLPEGLQFIGDYAFFNSGIQSINIPKSVVYLGINPFAECDDLVEISVPEGHVSFHLTNKTLYDKVRNRMVTYYGQNEVPEKTLRDGTLIIDDRNFSNANIQRLVFNKELMIICDDVLTYNSTIEEVVLPQGLREIGMNFMKSCKQVATVIVPESVTIIGSGSFTSCDKLTLLLERDSVAESYAMANGIPFQYSNASDSLDWLNP